MIRIPAAACAALAFAAIAVTGLPAAAQVRTIATNPQGSLGYATGAAIAKVLSEKTKIVIRVVPASGSSTYIPRINSGEFDFGFANVAETEWAVEGKDTFKGRPNPNIRLIAVTYPISLAFLVPFNSPAKSLKDLKGKRLPTQYVAQSIFRSLSDAALAAEGLTNADFQPVPVNNYITAVKDLGEGKVDLALAGVTPAVVHEVHADLRGAGGLRDLPVPNTPEAVQAMRRHFPGAYVMTLKPAKSMPGVREPIGALTYSNFMIVGKQVPDDVVYTVIKTMHDNAKQLGEMFAPLRQFVPARMNEAHPVAYHPGAVRYYKEVGQWPPKER
jgi:TRAP transporter TAXI family solute receptor